MSKIKATLALLIAATAFALTSATPSTAAAQDGGSVSYYHYYVYRVALHTGGFSYTQEYGPFNSQAEAEAKCDQLDSQRSFGSFFYGPSWWEREVNPNVFTHRNPIYNQMRLRR